MDFSREEEKHEERVEREKFEHESLDRAALLK
jgi:hypothetical protein